MKQLHRKDMFAWSIFNEERDLDFHSYVWVREGGNVVVDPLPMSAHDHAHLQKLGGVDFIVITNSDHCRAAEQLAGQTRAEVFGPAAEQDTFPIICNRWLYDGDEIVAGLHAHVLHGSKTPGELALLLEHSTLITGDLIRCHSGGELCILPDAKLTDRKLAIASVKRIANLPGIQAVLTGDGWPLFAHGSEALHHLARSL